MHTRPDSRVRHTANLSHPGLQSVPPRGPAMWPQSPWENGHIYTLARHTDPVIWDSSQAQLWTWLSRETP